MFMGTFPFNNIFVYMVFKKRERSVNEWKLIALERTVYVWFVLTSWQLPYISNSLERDSCVLHSMVPGSNVSVFLLLKTGPAFHWFLYITKILHFYSILLDTNSSHFLTLRSLTLISIFSHSRKLNYPISSLPLLHGCTTQLWEVGDRQLRIKMAPQQCHQVLGSLHFPILLSKFKSYTWKSAYYFLDH